MAYKFRIGDQVRFLNETGGGRITDIDVKGMVFVQTEDGFEIPVMPGALIPARGFSEDFPEKEEIKDTVSEIRHFGKAEKPLEIKERESKLPANIPFEAETNVLVGFVPNDSVPVFSSDISCFLINDSDFFLYYLAGAVRQGNYFYLASGMLESNMKYHIKTFSHSELSKISDIHIQAIFISEGRYNPRNTLDILVDISKINFSKESFYRSNEYFDSKAVIFGEEEKVIGRADQKTEENLSSSVVVTEEKKKRIPDDTIQVDLHIENLAENINELSPSDIINLQMRKFHGSIEEAIEKKAKRLIVVHGVGQGTLKMQIRKELQEKYPQYSFQDASFKEYGFGATLVHLHIIKKQ